MKKIIDLIKEEDNFIIVSHFKVDGDAIGSVLGLTLALKKLGKNVQAIKEGPIPNNLSNLPGIDLVMDSLESWNNSWEPKILICLDSANKDRFQTVIESEYVKNIQIIVNIDHHISNNLYGNINYVNPTASSTGELVTNLLLEADLEITKEIATNLYVAILTDTGNFSFSNTTGSALKAAGILIEKGAKPEEIIENIYQSKSFNLLKLEAKVLNHTYLEKDNLIIWSYLTKSDFNETKTDFKDSGTLVSLLTKECNHQVAILFIECNEGIKISFRGKGYIDLAEFASKFGGGGHRRASGIVMKDITLSSSIEKILEALILECNPYLEKKY